MRFLLREIAYIFCRAPLGVVHPHECKAKCLPRLGAPELSRGDLCNATLVRGSRLGPGSWIRRAWHCVFGTKGTHGQEHSSSFVAVALRPLDQVHPAHASL